MRKLVLIPFIIFTLMALTAQLLAEECTAIDYISATDQYIITCVNDEIEVYDMFLMDGTEFEILVDLNASN